MTEIMVNPVQSAGTPYQESSISRPPGLSYDKPVSRTFRKLLFLSGFVVTALIVVFLFLQFSMLRNIRETESMLAASGTPIATSPIPTNSGLPVVSQPSENSFISSPLIVLGTVPTGWMFEGVFPIQLISDTDEVLATGLATEVVPGSWQSGEPVNFTANLSFSTSASSGFLLLAKDNPSGLEENEESSEIPVRFSP